MYTAMLHTWSIYGYYVIYKYAYAKFIEFDACDVIQWY